MTRGKKIVIGCIIGVAAIIGTATMIFLPKIPLDEYTKSCLYIAVMDNEIAENRLTDDGMYIDRREALMYRYRLYLEMYKSYTADELQEEVNKYEQLLEESKKEAFKENEYYENNGLEEESYSLLPLHKADLRAETEVKV